MNRLILRSERTLSRKPAKFEFVIQVWCHDEWMDTVWGANSMQAAYIVAEARIKKDDCWPFGGDRLIRIVKARTK